MLCYCCLVKDYCLVCWFRCYGFVGFNCCFVLLWLDPGVAELTLLVATCWVCYVFAVIAGCWFCLFSGARWLWLSMFVLCIVVRSVVI